MPVVGTSTKTKPERLDARVTPEQKDLIARGAAARGQSLTDFVVSSAQAAAEAAIRARHVLTLTGRDSEALASALLDPPSPSDRLVAAARRYREELGWPVGAPEFAAASPPPIDPTDAASR